ncbi:hypothetical protein [Mesobacillus harenae]|uniref:hypothetical protein n=1 Tax=Mesobacillus harenae TaxID=2213203 RepID=UPI0015811ED5|nr:hypothetical protein [Mesobacillus harenae]
MDFRGIIYNSSTGKTTVEVTPVDFQGYLATARDEAAGITVQEYSDCPYRAHRMALELLKEERLLGLRYGYSN